MSKRPRTTAVKSSEWKKKKIVKKDPLDRWALEPGFKMNLKRVDTTVSAYFGVTTSTAGLILNGIPQGVGDNSRVGQRVRMFNFTVRGEINFLPTATAITQPDSLRLLIVYDRQTNGVAPPYSNVIANITTGTSLNLDPPNWYERGRYKILRDWVINVPSTSATVAAGLITANGQPNVPHPNSSEFNLHFFKALKGKIDTIYSGTGATAANVNGGGIFVMAQLGSNQNGNVWAYALTASAEFMDV